MKYRKLILALILIALIGSTAYGANVITGLTLHGVVQKITPETGDDSLTVRDDSLWIVIDDTTRISFIAGDHGGARLQGGINKTIEIDYDSIFVDADTNTATPIILFGGYGGALRWDRTTDKMQFSNDLSSWSDIGTSSGMAAADFNDSLESQIEFSPKTYEKLDSSTAVRGAINDSLQTNWATFTAAGSGMPAADFNDSLESQSDFSPNIFNRIDTTTAKIPTATLADSTDGGAITSETTKLADSTIAVPDSIDCEALTANRHVKATAIETDSIYISGDLISDFAGNALSVSGSNVLDVDDVFTWNDGDTVTGTHVFASIFRTTSAESDSSLTTIRDAQVEINDSLQANWADFTTLDLDEVGNPSGDHTFVMANKDLKFTWTTGGSYDGGLELEAVGNYADEDLMHIHFHTGNAGDIDLLHIESEDVDVTAFHTEVPQAADTNSFFDNGEVFIDRADIDTLDIGGDVFVDLIGTNLSVASNILNVDDAFLVNDANDETSGTITSTGLIIGSADVNEAELEIIDGATLTTTELNYVDGVTSDIQTQLDSKDSDPRYLVTTYNPNALWVADSILVLIDTRTPAAITVTRIDVTCDADPSTELDFDLMWCDAFIDNANRIVIDEMNTTSGTTVITSGFDDADIAANKCIYIRYNAEPDANILQVGVRVTYTID